VDSSVVGYDGAVRDEEHSVWQTKPEREQKEETKQSRWGFRGMTVREWLELLIVPVVLALITVVFSWQQNERQQDLEDQRVKQAQKIESQRAKAERELAEQRAQDEALQAYLSQMSSLLLEKDLRESTKEDSEVRTLARARTLTVLSSFDPSGKTAVMQFLEEATLVQRVAGRDPIISLRSADLSGADLNGFYLSGAYLSRANLFDAYLSDANLSGAEGITNEELEQQAVSLKGATMPNGQKYEDWLKDREKRQQDE
jgi:multidrug efflux pump subunit AcrA (membrane-fusion protein)